MTQKQHLNVLVVDDNEANCKLVAELLRMQQLQPSIAHSGDQAIELCKDHSFDLILLDLNMPGRNGRESVSGLRQNDQNQRTPIVALTAEDVEDIKVELLQADMDDFLSKPISESDLNHVIHRWQLARHPQTQVPSRRQKVSHDSPTKAGTGSLEENTGKSPLAVFNVGESLELSKNMPDLALDMFTYLLNSLDDTKEQLATLLEDQKYDALFDVAHKFLGGCCYCGVPRLRAQAKRLDKALNSTTRDTDGIRIMTMNLIDEINALQAWAEEVELEALFSE